MIGRTSVAERAAHVQEKAREFLDDAPSVVSRARSLVTGESHFFAAQPRIDQIRKQLEDESINTKKDGMKRIIAQICLGQDMAPLFPDVVKNVLINSIELRKLIYFYIVHYCEARPNESLLSISAFQRDLVDASMHVRALALRVLASIRLPAIHPVVMIAIKKCSTDPSSIVRKTAAIALIKAFVITKGQESLDVIIQLIHTLLGDRSTEVVGAAALAFLEVCPQRYDLIHKHFRKICRGLIETDEWSQCVILQMLIRYARSQFTDPNATENKKATPKAKAKKPADDDSDSDTTSSDDEEERDRLVDKGEDLDTDLRLLLTCVKSLFMSLNRAVVVAAASLYYHCAPESEWDVCVRPLIRMMSGAPYVQHVALMNMYAFVQKRSSVFAPYVKDFFLQTTDNAAIREVKLRILARLATKDNLTVLLHDLRSHLRSFDIRTTVDVIRGFGWIAFQVTESHVAIMRLITPLLAHANEEVVTESVVILRQLVTQCQDKSQTSKIVLKLVQSVLKKEITAPLARASIVWLVGDNIRTHPNIAKVAPDFFRIFVKTFTEEDPAVKRVVVTLGLKLWLLLEGEGPSADRFKRMFMHLLELVKFDNNYDVRDQGRMVVATLDRSSPGFTTARAAVIGDKPPMVVNDSLADRSRYQLGSLSHCIGAQVLNYEDLAEWPTEAPDPTVRDPPEAVESDFSDASTDSTDSSSSSSSSSESDSDDDSDQAKKSSDSSDDSDDSSSPKKPKATPAAAAASTAPAPPRPKIITKVMSAPKAAPTKDRIISELFAKPHASSGDASGKHADPFQKMFGGAAAAGPDTAAAAASSSATAPVEYTPVIITGEASGVLAVGFAVAEGSEDVTFEIRNVSDSDDAVNVHFEAATVGLNLPTEVVGTIKAGETRVVKGKITTATSAVKIALWDGERSIAAALSSSADAAEAQSDAAADDE